MNKLLVIKKSSIDRRGGFSTQDIPAKTKIIQYQGKKISLFESLSCNDTTYHYQLDMDYVVVGENDARFLNHSCSPNCYSTVQHGKIWVIAKKDIKKGEELTFNYGYDFEDALKNPCLCDTENCVGYIADSSLFHRLKKHTENTNKKRK